MVTINEAIDNPVENLGKDIQMIDNDIVISASNDFAVVKHERNLEQAIKNRLQTALGEVLINQEYGSNVPLLLGNQKDEILRMELESAIRFAMLQEPRVDEVIKVIIEYPDVDKNMVNVSLEVKPIDSIEPMNMVFELFL